MGDKVEIKEQPEVESPKPKVEEEINIDEKPVDEFEPLFPEENEALDSKMKEMGYDPEKDTMLTSSPEKAEEEKAEETPPEKSEETAAPEPEGEEEPEKPPKGFVPKEALFEERTKRKALAQKLSEMEERFKELEQQLKKPPEQEKKSEEEETPFKDFKVLDDEELTNLFIDDPEEYAKYVAKLSEYKAWQVQQQLTEKQKREAEERRRQQIEEQHKQAVINGVNKIVQAIPDFYDVESDVNVELAKFAVDNGVSAEAIAVMTDPRTKIVPYGKDDPVPAGTYAAELVIMINNLYKALNEAKNTEQLEQKIREQVTKERTEKMHAGSSGGGYVSLGDAPSARGADDMDSSKKVYTEEEWARLPEAERIRLLGGSP